MEPQRTELQRWAEPKGVWAGPERSSSPCSPHLPREAGIWWPYNGTAPGPSSPLVPRHSAGEREGVSVSQAPPVRGGETLHPQPRGVGGGGRESGNRNSLQESLITEPIRTSHPNDNQNVHR
ncbi:hypothetical protein MATL_G00144390 [Megalops atlanticus]|uniref:Uncharacterized protein n=1 Tax=Megalops atlanticus TaxID=7932 RepID=A0A9D3TB54_MEGAT|nr:hypothetical protein MATL_G00144390 [Megalops atlanticus]